MIKVGVYSLLMILGMLLSQFIDLKPYFYLIHPITFIILAYIMIEVGLEFDINKRKLSSYGTDYLVAMTAAAFPWVFCTLYFWLFFPVDLTAAAIVGRFAAPTSAGVLFTMLAAAGLATTWVFKKARILAIFDDLDTVLMIIPLQMMHMGFNIKGIYLLCIIAALLMLGYRFLHSLRLPSSRGFIFIYAVILTLATEFFEKTTLISLEILLPAFVLGCMLPKFHPPKEKRKLSPDELMKYGYMFLVGCSLPQISYQDNPWLIIVFHVLMLTILSNLGKLYPIFCYKKESTFKERLALSIAMWPRGEVGAGILIISMKYAILSQVIELAGISLALNLALTGFFIYIVLWLLKRKPARG